ncbi:MAG TPA: phosphoribosylamine--glycine ligase, partial [Myxococcaceae bacterium]|nr:phosphoribosylamine--glycine ligase [Myxococcaceae bacterium]
MRILIIGSGAREHALAWKISQSKSAEVLCAPGNPGTAKHGENLPVALDDPMQIAKLAQAVGAALVVIGPEAPLVQGAADAIRAAGIPVFGPAAEAAAIEGSKAFAKQVMEKAGVPTAAYRLFHSAEEAEQYVRARGRVVVKADGLAGGKGVVVANDAEEAVEAIRSLAKLGPAARRLL